MFFERQSRIKNTNFPNLLSKYICCNKIKQTAYQIIVESNYEVEVPQRNQPDEYLAFPTLSIAEEVETKGGKETDQQPKMKTPFNIVISMPKVLNQINLFSEGECK